MSMAFVCMIALNNICLKYVSISFYMVARSLSPFFNMILIYAIFGEKTSFKAVFGCLVLILGFIVGIDQEKNTGI
jgi:solute carrier family 35 (GDP-fucose transporter), member C1